jgi:NCAIR mutase (PurE)-related protein
VVLAGGKRPGDVAAIVATLLDATGSCCISRMRRGHRRAVDGVVETSGATLVAYGRRAARLLAAGAQEQPRRGLIGLLAAGTSDIDALEEARMVCEAAGCETRSAVDVGVAGIHRLFEPLAGLLAADVDAIVVAAGMDGALASVVAGLAGVPVIGLPVSTGYGAGAQGRAALLSMLQSCAPGLTVVNIDNGVGAGAAAALVSLRRRAGLRATAAVPARTEQTARR